LTDTLQSVTDGATLGLPEYRGIAFSGVVGKFNFEKYTFWYIFAVLI
jgi:hypothetical protein